MGQQINFFLFDFDIELLSDILFILHWPWPNDPDNPTWLKYGQDVHMFLAVAVTAWTDRRVKNTFWFSSGLLFDFDMERL